MSLKQRWNDFKSRRALSHYSEGYKEAAALLLNRRDEAFIALADSLQNTYHCDGVRDAYRDFLSISNSHIPLPPATVRSLGGV